MVGEERRGIRNNIPVRMERFKCFKISSKNKVILITVEVFYYLWLNISEEILNGIF
jgi:hypothetical protein